MNFIFTNQAGVGDILESLYRNGIAVVRDFLEEQELESLNEEFNIALSGSDPAVYSLHRHPNNSGGRVARVRTCDLTPSVFPKTRGVFLSRYLHDISDRYFSPHRYILNEDLFFTHELPCEREILPWHFDRQQSLKFWIYMVDTTVDNGAFEYCPGTHNEGHFRANYYLLKGVPRNRIPNDLPIEELRNRTPIEGNAGDLVIFDPDGFHRGGVVQPGMERKVIRGHTHPVNNYSNAKFSFNRFLSLIYRLQSQLGCRLERQLGEEVATRAMKTRNDIHVNLQSNRK